MPPEGSPENAEKKEKEPITDMQCLEAMKAENFEVVREWYSQQEKIIDAKDHQARLDLQIRYARLQLESGLIDEDTGESYAIPTLESLLEAYPAEGDETAHTIQGLIDQIRGK